MKDRTKIVGRTPSGRHVYLETLSGRWFVRLEGEYGLDQFDGYPDEFAARNAAEFLVVPQCELAF